MGLLEELAGAVLGGGGRSSGVSNDQMGALVRGVLESLGGSDAPNAGGGFEDLSRRFEQGGAGDVFGSWVGTGQNRSVGADALDYLRAQLSLAMTTEDIVEGVTAFFEKREPNWKGC